MFSARPASGISKRLEPLVRWSINGTFWTVYQRRGGATDERSALDLSSSRSPKDGAQLNRRSKRILREINETKLLSAEEEQMLAR